MNDSRPADRFSHHISRKRAGGIEIGADLSVAKGVDGITVKHRMDRTDGSGIAVMGHAGNLRQFCFGEFSVGDDGADGCVLIEQVSFFTCRIEAFFRMQELTGFSFDNAGKDFSCVFIIDIAGRVDRDNGADFQTAQLNRVNAKT